MYMYAQCCVHRVTAINNCLPFLSSPFHLYTLSFTFPPLFHTSPLHLSPSPHLLSPPLPWRQDESLRIDQEEQFPGVQHIPHPQVRLLSPLLPQTAAQRENHPLRPQTGGWAWAVSRDEVCRAVGGCGLCHVMRPADQWVGVACVMWWGCRPVGGCGLCHVMRPAERWCCLFSPFATISTCCWHLSCVSSSSGSVLVQWNWWTVKAFIVTLVECWALFGWEGANQPLSYMYSEQQGGKSTFKFHCNYRHNSHRRVTIMHYNLACS